MQLPCSKLEQLRKDLAKILDPVQETTGCHKKTVVFLRQKYEQADFEDFYTILSSILLELLKYKTKPTNRYVENMLEFFALFLASFKCKLGDFEDVGAEEDKLFMKIFDLLMQVHDSVNRFVRLRTCHLLNRLLDLLVDRTLSVDIVDQIVSSLLERFLDPSKEIRLEAIKALRRLQDPSDKDDRITKTYTILMCGDINAKVRETCIECVCLRKDVVSKMFKSLRDVNENVRMAVLKRLGKIPLELKIFERQLILKRAYSDTEKIQQYTDKELIPHWLYKYNKQFFDVLKSVKKDSTEDEIRISIKLCEKIMESFFVSQSLTEMIQYLDLNEAKVIPYERLTWESAIYWRMLVDHMRSHDLLEEEVENILPDLVDFSKYIIGYCQLMKESSESDHQSQSILNQLFLITKGYDVADTATRGCLNQLVSKTLVNMDLEAYVVETVVRNLEVTIKDTQKRAAYLCELILEEIVCPMKADEEQAKEENRLEKIRNLKDLISEKMIEQCQAIQQEDFMVAQVCQVSLDEMKEKLATLEIVTEVEVSEKKKDVPTIIKYLDIVSGFLQSPQIKRLTPSINMLKEVIVEEMLIHNDEIVQAKSLKCFALLCIVDRSLAEYGIHLLASYLLNPNATVVHREIMLISIMGTTDLLRLYGSSIVAKPPERALSDSYSEEHQAEFIGGTSLSAIVKALIRLLNHEDYLIHEEAGKALCDLINSRIILTSKMVSTLILVWCTPNCDDDISNDPRRSFLKLYIGIMLNNLPNHPHFKDIWSETVIQTVRCLVFAPEDSQLINIGIDDTFEFLIMLPKLSEEKSKIYKDLALNICDTLDKYPTNRIAPIYTKFLLMLEPPGDASVIEDLLERCICLQDKIKDRDGAKNLIKYYEMLMKLSKPAVSDST